MNTCEKFLRTLLYNIRVVCSISVLKTPVVSVQFQFIRDPGTARDKCNLICDLVCAFVITPLTVVTAYMCINGGFKYYTEEDWERTGLFALSTILMSIYIVWFVVSYSAR